MKDDQASSLRKQLEDASDKQLPPRSAVHANKKQQMKWRIKFPLIRLLVVCFLFLVLLVPGIHLWNRNAQVDIAPVMKAGANIERIEFEPIKKEVPKQMTPEAAKKEVPKQITPEMAKKEAVSPAVPVAKPKPNSKPDYKIHIVRKGETLYRISMIYYHSRSGETRIRAFNKLGPSNQIYEGQRLMIPLIAK